MGVLSWTCRIEEKLPSKQTSEQSGHATRFMHNLGRSEELRSKEHYVRARLNVRVSFRRPPGGERQRKRKRSTIFRERTMNGDRDANIGSVLLLQVMLNVLGCRLTSLLGTSRSMVQYSFTSTETVRLVRTDSPGRPPRLSHSS